MKAINVLILLIISLNAVAQPHNQSDLQKEMLKGRVKYIRYTNYVLPQADTVITGIKPDNYNIDSFNQKGYKLKYYHVDSGKVTSYIVYNYNDKGLLVDKMLVAKEITRIMYTYDTAASKILQANYKADGSVMTRITSVYDDKGNIVEQQSRGVIDNKCVIQNDDNGKPLQMFCYGRDEKLENKLVYTYDAMGMKTGVVNYGPDGKILDRTKYKYDAKGNETELLTQDGNGVVTATEITHYEYDNTGNWLKMVKTDATGSIKTAISREIFYY